MKAFARNWKIEKMAEVCVSRDTDSRVFDMWYVFITVDACKTDCGRVPDSHKYAYLFQNQYIKIRDIICVIHKLVVGGRFSGICWK